MAEVTGELGGQPIILDNAATETTLQLLVQAVNAANPNKGRAAQIQKMYDDALVKTTKSKAQELKALQEEEKQRKDLNKLLDEEKERRKKVVEDLQGFSEVLGKGLGAAFATATPKITDFTDSLSGLPIVGPIFSALGRAAQGQLDAFRQLTSTGADLGGSLKDIRDSAASAGLSLDDYVHLITKNSETFARLAGNVSTGARMFREISGTIQNNFGKQLANLGFSMADVSDFTAGYLEVQTKLGNAQRMNQTELINGSKEYILELDQLSRATGIERKQLQDKLKQAADDQRLKALSIEMGKQSGKVGQAFAMLQTKLGPGAEALFDIMYNQGVAMTGLGKSFQNLSPSVTQVMMRFRETQNIDELMKGLSVVGQELEMNGQSMGNSLATLVNVTSRQGKEVLSSLQYFSELQKMGIGLTQAQQEQKEELEAVGRSMASFDRAILNIRNAFMRALGPALEYFENKSSKFVIDLQTYIQMFANWVTELIAVTEKDGLGAAIGQMFSDIMSKAAPIIGQALFDLFTNPLVIASLAAAIGTASFVAGAAAKAGGGLADIAGGMLGGGGKSQGPSRDPKTGRFVKGGAQPGAGLLGGLTEGVLTGVANGLSAFANPKILVGAGILGGAIVIIGGAIAGASWLMGKALPTLAEGMRSMEELDGEKLQSVGLGLASIGGGLLVFGSGSAIGSITSAVGSLVDGVAGFFGAKSPIEKLREFSVVGNELGKSAEGFNAFKLAITDMPLNNLNFTDKQLENLDIGTAKIRRLSSSLTKVREEMKAISSPSITETVTSAIKDIGQAITSKLGNKEGKEATVETLMTDLNNKVDLLNNNMAVLVNINQNMAPDVRKTARNTKTASGVV